MSLEHIAGATLDDALLVRRLHDELDDDARHALDLHLARCEGCAARLAGLATREQRTRDVLRTVDFDVPDLARLLEQVRAVATERRKATRLRIAAGWILAVLAAGALATAPVRAWIAERLASLQGDAPAAPAAVTQPEAGSASLRFSPSGPGIAVTIARLQTTGTLTVRFAEGDAAEVRVTGRGLDALTVGRLDMRIDNDAQSTASWEITLPRVVEHADVHLGTMEAVRIARGEPVRIALDSGRRVRTDSVRDEPS